MKHNYNDSNELTQLLEQLGYDPELAHKIFEDITRGDQLLRHHDNLTIDPAVLTRLQLRISRELPRTRRRMNALTWTRRTALAAAAVFIALGLGNWLRSEFYQTKPIPQYQTLPVAQAEIDLFENDLYLWELTLVQEDEPELEIDDLLINEVLLLWSEADWDIDKLFGKVRIYENYITYAVVAGSVSLWSASFSDSLRLKNR